MKFTSKKIRYGTRLKKAKRGFQHPQTTAPPPTKKTSKARNDAVDRPIQSVIWSEEIHRSANMKNAAHFRAKVGPLGVAEPQTSPVQMPGNGALVEQLVFWRK